MPVGWVSRFEGGGPAPLLACGQFTPRDIWRAKRARSVRDDQQFRGDAEAVFTGHQRPVVQGAVKSDDLGLDLGLTLGNAALGQQDFGGKAVDRGLPDEARVNQRACLLYTSPSPRD